MLKKFGTLKLDEVFRCTFNVKIDPDNKYKRIIELTGDKTGMLAPTTIPIVYYSFFKKIYL